MKRKLVKQAGQAITITLPIEWIRENNLKAGDEINLELQDKSLVIHSANKIITGKSRINCKGFTERMRRIHINAAYAKGVDEIELMSDKNYYPDVSQALGYAVVQQKEDKQVIRDISGQTNENLDEIFKRLFQMIFSFYDRMCEAVEAKDPGLKEVSEKMDAEINKFVFFLERSIMKMSYPDPAIGRVLFAYSFNLEKISDEVQRMWRIRYEEKTITINEKVKEIMEMSKQALELAFQIYYHATPELILKVIELKKDMRKKTAKLFNINPGTTKFVMHALRIAEDCSDLTHLSLMKSIPLNND